MDQVAHDASFTVIRKRSQVGTFIMVTAEFVGEVLQREKIPLIKLRQTVMDESCAQVQ
jgi:hypothetical protein